MNIEVFDDRVIRLSGGDDYFYAAAQWTGTSARRLGIFFPNHYAQGFRQIKQNCCVFTHSLRLYRKAKLRLS